MNTIFPAGGRAWLSDTFSAGTVFAVFLLGAATLIGCVNAATHMSELHPEQERQMTVGVVQREIKKGMSQGEVATALGAPNIVSRDSDGHQTWIYDKIATTVSYSESSGSYAGLGAAGGGPGSSLLLGLGAGAYGKNAGARAQTQKTLTVVVKFDGTDRVNDFSYHSSTF